MAYTVESLRFTIKTLLDASVLLNDAERAEFWSQIAQETDEVFLEKVRAHLASEKDAILSLAREAVKEDADGTVWAHIAHVLGEIRVEAMRAEEDRTKRAEKPSFTALYSTFI